MLGMQVGPYRISRLLGEGGMGAVYEAVNDFIERRAAIKVLHQECARQPEVVARFFNEARAAKRINHPCMVQIYELGSLPGKTASIVMEYLDGLTLAKCLQVAQADSLLMRRGRGADCDAPGHAACMLWQTIGSLLAEPTHLCEEKATKKPYA